ncbi:VOC family protein [Amylibacter sp. SFDW26]|nr:VOC family protein [Amylibacter sp. SFDW26]
MLFSVCVGTNDLAAAAAFYDGVMAVLNMERVAENDVEVGYGAKEQDASFWVLKPFNKEPASFGNGSQVILRAESSDVVQAFHAKAMEMGGSDEGAPGPRDYAQGYYGAYARDLDGNKLHVFYLPNA